MNETKHTPGPWHVYKGHGLYVDSSTAGSVCKVAEKRASEQQIANAALIAAAPEMLEIIRGIFEAATSYSRTSPEWLIERLAPAKALLEKL